MKKLISLFIVTFCLFSATKAFSQCIVSGGDLKEPITYQTIEEMKKDYKKLKKASRNTEITLEFPEKSTLRNYESLEKIFVEIFFWGWRFKEFNGSYSKGSQWKAIYSEEIDTYINNYSIVWYFKIKNYDGDCFEITERNMPTPREFKELQREQENKNKNSI